MRSPCDVALAILLASPASVATVQKFVAAGETVRLGPFIAVRGDCSTPGKATLSMLQSPTLGTLETVDSLEQPHFKDKSPAHVCNDRKVPATVVLYHARPGASGVDDFSFALIYDFLKPTRHTFSVLVK